MELAALLTDRNIRYLFPFLAATIAVYFVSSLVVFFMDLKVAGYSPAEADVVSLSEAKPHDLHPVDHYKRIWERNLFSVKIDEAHKLSGADLMAQIDKLALTSLNCTLIGTVLNEGGSSWAIIRDNQSGKEEKVAVDSVISGAKVTMILRNKVVLNINGKDELLVMGIEKIRADQASDREPKKEGASGEGLTYKISRDFVRESINNLPQIMSKVRIKPFMKDGKPQGFQITNIQEGSLFKTMGFENNDVIKSVNGQVVKSPEDAMRLYNILKDSDFFSISIVRNNQDKTLNYKVR